MCLLSVDNTGMQTPRTLHSQKGVRLTVFLVFNPLPPNPPYLAPALDEVIKDYCANKIESHVRLKREAALGRGRRNMLLVGSG